MSGINLPENWKILPFEDCLGKVKSKKVSSIPKRDYLDIGEFPVIDQGSESISGWTDATESVIFDNLPVVVFGDHTRTFKYVDFPFAIGADGTKLLYANDNVLDVQFFYFALLNLKVPNKGYNRHYRYLREFSIVIPPLPEQRAIASVLCAIQEAKFARQKEIALERERKAALMDYLFSHGTKGEPRKQTEIGEIPESWEVVEIGDIGNVVTGNTPKTTVPEYYGGPHMFVSPGDITEAQYITKTNKYVSDRGLKVLRPLPRNAVLVVCIGATIGKTAMTSTDQSVTNQQINAVVPNEKAFPHYIYYALTNRSPYLPSLAGRAAIPIVKKSIFAKFPIPLPSLSEQRSIAESLQAFDEKIAALKQETAPLDELFHAMLEELMTGQRSAVPLIDSEIPD